MHGRTVAPDADPEKGYYFRSDHFEFAKQGVPALDPKGGRQYIGKSADFGQRKHDEYTAKDYHKVSDEVKPDWDLSGAVEDLKLLVELGYRVAQGDDTPSGSPTANSEPGVRPCSRGRNHESSGRSDRTRFPMRQGTHRVTPGPNGRWLPLALLTTAMAATGAWLDVRYGWITPAFDAVAHQFYEVPLLAAIRRPSQLVLVRWHLAIGSVLAVLGFVAGTQVDSGTAELCLRSWASVTRSAR